MWVCMCGGRAGVNKSLHYRELRLPAENRVRERAREREREATGHRQWLRERWGRAVCQRWRGAFDVLVVSDSAQRAAPIPLYSGTAVLAPPSCNRGEGESPARQLYRGTSPIIRCPPP